MAAAIEHFRCESVTHSNRRALNMSMRNKACLERLCGGVECQRRWVKEGRGHHFFPRPHEVAGKVLQAHVIPPHLLFAQQLVQVKG